MDQLIMTAIFIDTSAFIALYLIGDDFHQKAVSFLKSLKGKATFATSNFVLDEVYTLLRSKKGRKVSIEFAEFLVQNAEVVKLRRISLEDEKDAFEYFKKFDFSGLSFTDCTSFALMKRFGIKEVFTFDRHFAQANFTVIP